MNEIWKVALGFDCYEVSDSGRVRRAKPGVNCQVGHVLSGYFDKDGYHCILLQRTGAKPKHTKVHRLVVAACLGAIPDGMQVNHKNGNKADNRSANLEVVSPSGNTLHGFRSLGRKQHSVRAKGSKHGNAILTEDAVRAIRRRYKSGETQVALAANFKTNQTNISKIVNRTAWSHVPD
jgi:hypothetical protein